GTALAALAAGLLGAPREDAPREDIAEGVQVGEAVSGLADPTSEDPSLNDPVFESAGAADPPRVEEDGAVPPPEPVISFIVRFAAPHALAAAQTQAAAGDLAAAANAARAAIRASRDLRGLCFDRFTAGGAEIVLKACTPVPRAQELAFQQRWTRRLAHMSGVEYADANYVLYPEQH
ncbi:MAG: hypothetical protein AB7L65_11360, partial [Hyphomonadaceae bacterium]